MAHRSHIAVALTLAWATTGCVAAVRHLVKEANRSSVQDKGRDRFPVGTSINQARATLTAADYRCLDFVESKKSRAHVSCSPSAHRTGGLERFLIGGDWQWNLYGDGDILTKVQIVSAGHGIHEARKPVAKTESRDTGG